jgi:hypothetical protein
VVFLRFRCQSWWWGWLSSPTSWTYAEFLVRRLSFMVRASPLHYGAFRCLSRHVSFFELHELEDWVILLLSLCYLFLGISPVHDTIIKKLNCHYTAHLCTSPTLQQY